METARRRYVGDRSRAGQIDQFIELSRSGDDNKRAPGLAALAPLSRAARAARGGTPATGRTATTPLAHR